jgi:hypothetical protein
MAVFAEEIAALRAELLGPKKIPLKGAEAMDARAVRVKALEMLLGLMDRTAKGIERASKSAERGSGGVSEYARLAQLLGYIIQVADGVLKNLQESEIERRLRELEEIAQGIEAGED